MFARSSPLLVLALTSCATSDSVEGTDAANRPETSAAAKEEVAVPQPLSAHVALKNVLDVLEEHRAQGRDIECRAIRADYIPGRAGKPDVVRVKLDLSFFAEDDLVGTMHYTNLRRALEQSPGCTGIESRATTVLEGGSGIYVDGLEITALPPAVARPTSLPEDSEGRPASALYDPELYVRGIANHSRVKLGQINTKTSQIQVSPTLVDDRIEIRSSERKRAYVLQQVLNYLILLERESDRVVVTGIELLPATKVRPHERVEDRWNFEAETTIRRRVQ